MSTTQAPARQGERVCFPRGSKRRSTNSFTSRQTQKFMTKKKKKSNSNNNKQCARPHTHKHTHNRKAAKQTKREVEAAPAAARRRRRRRQKGKGSWEEEARKPVVVVVGTQESRPQHIAATVRESQRKEHLKKQNKPKEEKTD